MVVSFKKGATFTFNELLDAVKYPRVRNLSELKSLAVSLLKLQEKVPFKLSSRGWCYQLEVEKVITKGQFDKTQSKINKCRKLGLLPIDFVAEEKAREFDFIERSSSNPDDYVKGILEYVINSHKYYETSFWKAQDVYIQMLVEKIDLKTLFNPICEKYHIPIATSKGWSSILQRAEMAARFKEAARQGKKTILLYCGDFDPYGLLIEQTLKKNFDDISLGTKWVPENLIVDRFGLNYDFIEELGLTWIENLESASGKQLDESLRFVQEYIEQYGRRKVEANAIVVKSDEAEELCENAVLKYLDERAFEKYERAKTKEQNKVLRIMNESGIRKFIRKLKV